jgi:hypothetical protein
MMCENEISIGKAELKRQRPTSLNLTSTCSVPTCSDDEEIDVVDDSDSDDNTPGMLNLQAKTKFVKIMELLYLYIFAFNLQNY